MYELKPCPFCGSADVTFEKTEWDEKSFTGEPQLVQRLDVRCNNCGASSGKVAGLYTQVGNRLQARAAELWNRRANDDRFIN